MSATKTIGGASPGSRDRPEIPARKAPRAGPTWRQALRRDWRLYSLAVLPLLFFAIFRYLPMIGNVIAFRKFEPGGSVLGEEWAACGTSRCS